MSYEELKMVVQSYGFEYLTQQFRECTYTRCCTSMMWTVYK